MEKKIYYILNFTKDDYVFSELELIFKDNQLHSFGSNKTSVRLISETRKRKQNMIYKYHYQGQHLKTFILNAKESYSHGILEKRLVKFTRYNRIPQIRIRNTDLIYITSLDGTNLNQVSNIFPEITFFDTIYGRYKYESGIYILDYMGQEIKINKEFLDVGSYITELKSESKL